MKRIASFLLVLLLIPGMVVPASATTADAIEDQTFWLLGDLDWFSDSLGGLGEIYYAILDAVDRLDWLDATMRDVETAIIDGLKTGVAETLGQLVVIIKDNVVSIQDAISSIKTSLDTGSTNTSTNTIGKVVYSIYNFLFNTLQGLIRSMQTTINGIKSTLVDILGTLGSLINGRADLSSSVQDEAEDKDQQISDINDVLATAPTIDQESFDSVISDIEDKYNNLIGGQDNDAFFGSLTRISELDVFREIVPVSVMLGLVSFVLFGKVF